MSDYFWNRLSHITGLMALAALIGLAAFSSNLEVRDLDIWLHLRTGQYIAEHHAVPKTDILSSTVATTVWNNHEWLFQVIFYYIYHVAGFDGLLTTQSIIVCVTLLLLFLMTYRKDRLLLGVSILLLVMLVYQGRFTLRPDLFSLLFFTIYMSVLAFHLDKRKSILILAIVQTFWANMHGYFFFGPLLVLIAVVSEMIKRHVPLPYEWNQVGRLTDNEYKNLKLMLVVVLGVCFINPYGVQGAIYPLQVLFHSASDTKIFFQYITELQPPFTKNFIAELSENIHYKALIVLSMVSFLLNRRKIDISVLFVWIVFLGFSLVAIRNMVFFACAAYLVILVNSMTISLNNILPLRFTTKRFEDVTSVLAKIALIFWIMGFADDFSSRGYFDPVTFKTKMEIGGVSTRSYPTKSVDFMLAQNIRGNIFNDFNSGAYLVGRMHPQIKVFIDGRTEVYGAKFFEYYRKIWLDGDAKTLTDAIKRYHLTVAFLNGTKQRINPKTIKIFYALKDWKLVFFDDEGLIFLKVTPQNQPIIDKFAVNLNTWVPPPMDFVRLGIQKMYPLPNIARSKYLIALGLYEPALKELKIALKIAPESIGIYGLLGDIYAKKKMYDKSFENFRLAASYYSGYDNMMGLGMSLAKLGHKAEAKKLYESLLKKDPKNTVILKRLKALTLKEEK